MTTVHSKPRFTVKEHTSGEPWIAIESVSSVNGMPQGQLGIDLPKGTTLPEAHQIAKYLQDKVAGISYTP